MKKRWKILLGAGGLLIVAAIAPIIYIEAACGPTNPAADGGARPALIKDQAWRRDEARTWLTYPEWHIVYSAESFGRFLEKHPPSAFPYWRHVRGFWSGYCAVNRAAPSSGAGEAKVMLYTIGLSYSAELLAKAAYENTIGRLFEWIGGWNSADDRYSARVQQIYGGFMHEQPWYLFPFDRAFSGLWRTDEPDAKVRHWERRLALSTEYGIKNGYAAAIGWASGATLGSDERTLQFVARASPAAIRAVDSRLKPVAGLPGGSVVVEAPRYAQFTDLLVKLSRTRTELVEISGNDDIFVTVLMPHGREVQSGDMLLSVPLDDRPGWSRVGATVKVAQLLPLLRSVRRSGGEVEHVYDY